MVRLGAALCGFSLAALFGWLPLVGSAQATVSFSVLPYLVILVVLAFGVYIVTNMHEEAGTLGFVGALMGGAATSIGFGCGFPTVASIGAVLTATFIVLGRPV